MIVAKRSRALSRRQQAAGQGCQFCTAVAHQPRNYGHSNDLEISVQLNPGGPICALCSRSLGRPVRPISGCWFKYEHMAAFRAFPLGSLASAPVQG